MSSQQGVTAPIPSPDHEMRIVRDDLTKRFTDAEKALSIAREDRSYHIERVRSLELVVEAYTRALSVLAQQQQPADADFAGKAYVDRV